MDDTSPRGTDWLLTIVMVLGHAFLWGLVLVLLLVFVPGQERQFRDFGLKLPEITAQVILWSRAISEYVVLVPFLFLATLIADGGIILLLRLGLGRRWLSWVWFILLAMSALVTLWLCWWAMWLPRQKLLEGLSK